MIPTAIYLCQQLGVIDFGVETRWLTDEAIGFYAIVIGEGWRFPEARKFFWEQYDHLWRVAFGYVCEHSPSLVKADIERQLDRQLLDGLKAC